MLTHDVVADYTGAAKPRVKISLRLKISSLGIIFRFGAVAVHAAMLGTNPAGLFQSLPQLLPGAMAAYRQIVLANTEARGHGYRVF